jgi:hypothetical protein
MLYNAITIPTPDNTEGYVGYAIIRPANWGVSDIEFQVGARMYEHAYPGLVKLTRLLETQDYAVLSTESWANHIADLFDPNQQADNTDFYRSSVLRPDKWDTRPEIY